MDNIENYLYILFALIYIISRVIKARSKQKQQGSPKQPQQQTPVSKPVQQQNQPPRKKAFSFEDILKEFEKNLAGEEESAYEKPLPVKEIKYEKPRPIPVKEVEKKPNPYDAYKSTSYKSIKEEIESDRKSSFTRSENYSIKDDVAGEYVKMLQDPQGFKNAIVLSEIINRKYF
jgi:hypothetical protein